MGANILHLGIKELRGLSRDPMLLFLIVYAFTLSVGEFGAQRHTLLVGRFLLAGARNYFRIVCNKI